MKIHKYIFNLILLTIIAVAIQDIYIDRFSPNRYYVQWTQLIVVVFGFSSLLSFFSYKSNFQESYFKWYLLFLSMLFFYAISSPYFFEIFPQILFTLLPAFTFYQIEKAGSNVEKKVQYFSIIVLFLSLYQLYLGFLERTILYGAFFKQADNTGYTLLGIMIVISLLKNSNFNIALISIAFLGALLSLKRGAMITSSVFYSFYIIGNINYFKEKKTIFNILLGLGFVSVIIFFIMTYYDFFAYRFMNDPYGSGRSMFYQAVFDGWQQSPLLNKVFGNGFFSVFDYLDSAMGIPIYAHSDWLEILYDHGLLGVMIFLGLLISLFNKRYDVKKYMPDYYLTFWGLLIVLFIKSLISGTYMTKFDIYTYSVIGYIFGYIQYQKNILPQYEYKELV